MTRDDVVTYLSTVLARAAAEQAEAPIPVGTFQGRLSGRPASGIRLIAGGGTFLVAVLPVEASDPPDDQPGQEFVLDFGNHARIAVALYELLSKHRPSEGHSLTFRRPRLSRLGALGCGVATAVELRSAVRPGCTTVEVVLVVAPEIPRGPGIA